MKNKKSDLQENQSDNLPITSNTNNKLNKIRNTNNKNGGNQFNNKVHLSLTPYPLRLIYCKALLDEGKTLRQIAVLTRLSTATIMKVKKGLYNLDQSWVNQAKKVESAKLTFLSNTILDSIDGENLDSASLLQKTTAASQLIDKRRLIDGESTENVSHIAFIDRLNSDREELMKRISELE